MKISDLKLEIKKYIVEILSEDVNEEIIPYSSNSISKTNAIKTLKNNRTYKQLSGKDRTDLEKSITQDTDGGILNLPEAKIDEARPSSALVIGDMEKANAVKDQYKGKWLEKMIDIIIDAGEAGIGQSAVADQLGKVQQAINPQVRALTAAGVFSTVGGAPAPSAPKEKIAKEKPVKEKPAKDEESDVEDTYYKADAEDVGFDDEKEPSKSEFEKAEKELGKGIKQAKKLSSEDEEKFQRLEKGIKAKVAKLEKMSTAERAKSVDMSILKDLISRKEVQNLFSSKGLDVYDLVSDIID